MVNISIGLDSPESTAFLFLNSFKEIHHFNLLSLRGEIISSIIHTASLLIKKEADIPKDP